MIPAAHVIFVLDDSGSMGASSAVTKKAFDGMVESLQLCKGADIVMSLIKYGSRPKLVYARQHIQEVKPVQYQPSDSNDTIYDSMLAAIKLAGESPRDEKPIIILQADGGDTCSRAQPHDVKKAVSAARAKGMEFLFLGANYNDEYEYYRNGDYPGTSGYIENQAKILGFHPEEVMLYNSNTAKESVTAFAEAATNVGAVASRLSEHAAFTKEQQEKVKG